MKKFGVVLCAVLVLAAAGTCFAAPNIGAAKAKAIALKHAAVAEQQAKFREVKLDRGPGPAKYELEFYANGKKYDYDINAETGKIMKFSREARDQSKAVSSASKTKDAKPGPDKGYIGEKKAKAAVLAKVPGSTERDIRHFELDKEHGRMVYEGDIRTNAGKYEFKIDAKSGEFVEWKQDH